MIKVYYFILFFNGTTIGTLYFIFGTFSGIIGTLLSLLIRLELALPENYFFLSNHQLYNVVVTAHAFYMMIIIVMAIIISMIANLFFQPRYQFKTIRLFFCPSSFCYKIFPIFSVFKKNRKLPLNMLQNHTNLQKNINFSLTQLKLWLPQIFSMCDLIKNYICLLKTILQNTSFCFFLYLNLTSSFLYQILRCVKLLCQFMYEAYRKTQIFLSKVKSFHKIKINKLRLWFIKIYLRLSKMQKFSQIFKFKIKNFYLLTYQLGQTCASWFSGSYNTYQVQLAPSFSLTNFKQNLYFKGLFTKKTFSFYLATFATFAKKWQKKRNFIYMKTRYKSEIAFWKKNFTSKEMFNLNYTKNTIRTLYVTIFLSQKTNYHDFNNPYSNPFFKPTRPIPKTWTGEERWVYIDPFEGEKLDSFGPRVPDAPLEVFAKKLIQFYNLWPFEQWAWSLVSLIILYWITGHFYGIWLHDTLRRWANRWIYISLHMRASLIVVDLAINLSLGLHYMEHRDTIMGQIMIKCPIAVSPVIFALELAYVTLYFFYYQWLIRQPFWFDFWLKVDQKPPVIKMKRVIRWLTFWVPIALFVCLWFLPATYFACYPGWKAGFLWFFFLFILFLLIMLD